MSQPKLLFAVTKPFYPDALGGSQRSGMEILRRLLDASWDVEVICRAGGRRRGVALDGGRAPWLPRVRCEEIEGIPFLRAGLPLRWPAANLWVRRFWLPWYRDHLRRNRPSVVLGDESAGCGFLRAATDLGIPAVYLSRSIPRFGSPTIFSKDLHFVANSDYNARVLEAVLGAEVPVVRPMVTPSQYRCGERRPRYVTMINPIEHKGGRVAVEIARRMPSVPFLFVQGRWAAEIGASAALGTEPPPNVELAGPFDDMRSVYAETRILLVPSQFVETFGRVVLEAQLNGIPVVASNVGGLPETVGRGGLVVEREDVDGFVEALASLEDSERYADVAARAASNAARVEFDPDAQFEVLLALLERLRGDAEPSDSIGPRHPA